MLDRPRRGNPGLWPFPAPRRVGHATYRFKDAETPGRALSVVVVALPTRVPGGIDAAFDEAGRGDLGGVLDDGIQ